MNFYCVFKEALALLTATAELAADYVGEKVAKVEGMVFNYFKSLMWVAKWVLGFVIGTVLVLAVCAVSGLEWAWVYSLLFVLLGLEGAVLLGYAYPILAISDLLFERLPRLKASVLKPVRLIASVVCIAMLLATYCYYFQVWRNPKTVFPALMAAAILGIGAGLGWINPPSWLLKKLIVGPPLLMLLGIVLTLQFPNVTPKIEEFREGINRGIKREPKKLVVTSADDIKFVDLRDGKNLIWYYQTPEGGYELYDADGFHQSGIRLKPADTLEIREKIVQWFRAEMKRARAKAEKDELVKQYLAAENRKRNELVSKHPASQKPIERKSSFEELTAGFTDAGLFDNHSQEFQYEFEQVWVAVEQTLSLQKEKVVVADRAKGIILTKSTEDGVADSPNNDLYFILIERVSDDKAKVTFKLWSYRVDFKESHLKGELKPDTKDLVAKQAGEFLERVNKALIATK